LNLIKQRLVKFGIILSDELSIKNPYPINAFSATFLATSKSLPGVMEFKLGVVAGANVCSWRGPQVARIRRTTNKGKVDKMLLDLILSSTALSYRALSNLSRIFWDFLEKQ